MLCYIIYEIGGRILNTIYAAIDLGSNTLKLKIVQYENNAIHIIDDITKDVNVGEDVFAKGNIEHETVKEIIDIMVKFKDVMNSYNVETYRAVATGAMRTAKNNLNVIEIVLMRAGIKIEIIEDTIEKFLTYKSMRDNIEDYRKIRESSILVELNSGSCDVSVYNKNKLVFNEEFTLGTLVLKNIMQDIEDRSVNYPKVISELIESRTGHMWKYIKKRKIESFLMLGGETKVLKNSLFGGRETISRSDFESVYRRVITDHLRFRKEIEEYGMDWYEFVACILVYKVFLKLADTKDMTFPVINLRDGMIAEMIEKDYSLERYKVFNNDVISLARNTSARYKSCNKHCREVEKNGIKIMNELKKHFTFNERDELLMRLAAILHEIGKFTRAKDYLAASFHKIRNLSIMGTNYHEMMLVAYICKMLTDRYSSRVSIERLSQNDQNRILKLSSILSIADALDKSKKQKIKIEDFRVTDDELGIIVSKSADTTLEEWNLENRAKEFINTFGLVPKLIEAGYDE